MPRTSSSQKQKSRRRDSERASASRDRGESSSGVRRRGFASMSPSERRDIAARGGRASHGGRGRDYQSPSGSRGRADYEERQAGRGERGREGSPPGGRYEREARDWDRRREYHAGARPEYGSEPRGPRSWSGGDREPGRGERFQGGRADDREWRRGEDDYRYRGEGSGRERYDDREYRSGDRWSDSRGGDFYDRDRFPPGGRSRYEEFAEERDDDRGARGWRHEDEDDDYDYEGRRLDRRPDFHSEGDDSRGGSRQGRRRSGPRDGRSDRRYD